MDAAVRKYMSGLGKKGGKSRWKGTSAEERTQQASRAGKAFWAKLTPEQRSAEMKRRAKKRKKGKTRGNRRRS